MAFRKIGNYNNLSSSVFPKLPPRGTVVTYRYLQTFEDPYAEKINCTLRKCTTY